MIFFYLYDLLFFIYTISSVLKYSFSCYRILIILYAKLIITENCDHQYSKQ